VSEIWEEDDSGKTFMKPSREQILERARALVPKLREKALQTEAERIIPRETHLAFEDAGLYKLFQPARYGGYEMPIRMLVEVAGELGRGCGSSAWIFTNLAVQNWIIGMHRPEAQEDMWGKNPRALAASSFPTQGGTGRYVDGGLLLNGIWSFASGIDYADWENLQCFIPKEGGPPDHRFVLVPKTEFTAIKDDWFVTGLSGTASKSIVFKDVFVPEHRVLNTQLIGGGPSPGSAVNPAPLYKVPPWSVGTKVFSGVCLGIARGALELIVEDLRAKLSVQGLKMAEMPTVQVRVAEASAEIDAAEALLLKDCDDAMRIAETTNDKPALIQRARWRLNNAYAGQLCLRAVERLHPLIGARGLGRDSLFQLAQRDIHAAVSQITMAWDIQSVNGGRIVFGLPSLDPRL
jgi:3-hydroxy-9,10-secoandrosta-1,3,5(10)-triene-9,17-dione monooxygenase